MRFLTCCIQFLLFLFVFLLAIGKLPRFGALKTAYDRNGNIGNTQKEEETSKSAASFLIFILSMVTLILVTGLCGNNIVIGIFAALLTLFLLLKITRQMTIQESIEKFAAGASTITPLLINICLGFILQVANERIGFTSYVIELCTSNVVAWMLPAMIFVLVVLTAFLAASFWILIVVCFPIFIPLAIEMGVPVELLIAAIMSGVALGSQACLYSDAIFMVSSATGVPNDVQFNVALPYVVIGCILSTGTYLIIGKLVIG
ncbi:MAG: Na+/H+ antiporter NhaC family protein [Eubacterium aggregans]